MLFSIVLKGLVRGKEKRYCFEKETKRSAFPDVWFPTQKPQKNLQTELMRDFKVIARNKMNSVTFPYSRKVDKLVFENIYYLWV